MTNRLYNKFLTVFPKVVAVLWPEKVVPFSDDLAEKRFFIDNEIFASVLHKYLKSLPFYYPNLYGSFKHKPCFYKSLKNV